MGLRRTDGKGSGREAVVARHEDRVRAALARGEWDDPPVLFGDTKDGFAYWERGPAAADLRFATLTGSTWTPSGVEPAFLRDVMLDPHLGPGTSFSATRGAPPTEVGSGVLGWRWQTPGGYAYGTRAHVGLAHEELASADAPAAGGGYCPCRAHLGGISRPAANPLARLTLLRHAVLKFGAADARDHSDFALYRAEAEARPVFGAGREPWEVTYPVAVYEGWVRRQADVESAPAEVSWGEKIDDDWVRTRLPGFQKLRRLWVPGRKFRPVPRILPGSVIDHPEPFAAVARVTYVPDPARSDRNLLPVVIRFHERVGAVTGRAAASRALVGRRVFMLGPKGLVWGEVVAVVTAFGIRYPGSTGRSPPVRFDNLVAVRGLGQFTFAGRGDSGSPVGGLAAAGEVEVVGEVISGIELDLPGPDGRDAGVPVTLVQPLGPEDGAARLCVRPAS